MQVLQSGNAATVNVFIDADATADLVIDVTVADGHLLTGSDFVGVSAQSQFKLDALHSIDSQMSSEWFGIGGLRSGLLVLSLTEQLEGFQSLDAVMPTTDLHL